VIPRDRRRALQLLGLGLVAWIVLAAFLSLVAQRACR
jgi:hypothetical protein